jgi:hypothetical protein
VDRFAALGVLVAIAVSGDAVQARPAAPVRISADLDADGAAERVEFRRGAPEAVSVWRGARRVWRGVPARWNAWKVRLGDVDGDGRDDLVIGVHKPTRYVPEPHNGLFVFGWDGRRAFPKWLGSSLARPFTDFDVRDVDGDGAAEVLSRESGRDGAPSVTVYSWRGFGFAVDEVRGDAGGEGSDAR